MNLKKQFGEVPQDENHNRNCEKVALQFTVNILKWLTSHDSEISIMYGNQRQRFADNDREYTPHELIKLYEEKMKTNLKQKSSTINKTKAVKTPRIPQQIAIVLDTILEGGSINKKELTRQIYGDDDYFCCRSFDVHLSKAKRDLAPKQFRTKAGRITRVT